MPSRPLRACAYPGCSTLVPSGRCAPHAVLREQARRNREVRTWYCTVAWSRIREAVLVDAAYTCASCGLVCADLDVDHIVKHHGDPKIFWDLANLQALCASCHSRKTQRGE